MRDELRRREQDLGDWNGSYANTVEIKGTIDMEESLQQKGRQRSGGKSINLIGEPY